MNLLFISFVVLLMPTLVVDGVASDSMLDDSIVLDSVHIRALLQTDGSTLINIDANVNNTSSVSIEYVPLRIDSLRVNITSVVVDSVVSTAQITLLDRYTELRIVLGSPLTQYATSRIHVELIAYDLQSVPVSSPDGMHALTDFILYIRPLTLMRNITLFVHLPPHASLSQTSIVPLFPAASGNMTDGHSMIFYWSTPQIQPGQERVFIVKYQTLLTTENTVVGRGVSELIVAGLVGLVAGIAVPRLGPVVWQRIRRIGAIRVVGVTHEESEILDAIRKRGGSCPQKDLYRELDMSAAKVSMMLSSLEERGLVRRFRDGRENMVHIIDSDEE